MKRKQATPAKTSHHHGTEVGAVAGELVGAVVGSAAGPAGTVAGMVLGAIAGALTGHVLEDEHRRAQVHDEELDETIGVTGGDLGAARANALPGPTGKPSLAPAALASPADLRRSPILGPL